MGEKQNEMAKLDYMKKFGKLESRSGKNSNEQIEIRLAEKKNENVYIYWVNQNLESELDERKNYNFESSFGENNNEKPDIIQGKRRMRRWKQIG